ncbi:hypothetical protein [Pedobacter sp. L105]|uniref:hypothetical protein n=1 Tax=Pedobacter sp. L105 TaxID=1641871 RepID=UPI00131A9921|nr:hypothetical protein [Pedobacter sp. L105]
MLSQFVQLLSDNQSLDYCYSQAVSGIESYCTWISSQSVADITLTPILEGVKTDASTWYNTIYPTYLNMPATIATCGVQIDNDLDMLISLVDQENQSGISAPLQQQITVYANALIAILQGLQSQVNALAVAIVAFQGNISGDVGTINNTLVIIQNNINTLNQELSTEYGQIHSLQNATCPNSGDINSCEKTISATQGQLQTESNAWDVFDQASGMAAEASMGAGYLAGFWQSFSADIQACLAGLNNITAQPASVVAADLSANKSRWDNMQSQLQQISDLLNPAN